MALTECYCCQNFVLRGGSALTASSVTAEVDQHIVACLMVDALTKNVAMDGQILPIVRLVSTSSGFV